MTERDRFPPHERNGHSPVPLGPAYCPMPEQLRTQIEALVSAGCSLRAAARAAGYQPAALRRAMEIDVEFRRAVLAAEARFEIRQLQRLDEAAKDQKNWRVAMWLLERRLPDRYGRNRPLAVKQRQVEPLLRALADVVVEAIDDPHQRGVLFERLKTAVSELVTEFPQESEHDGP